MKSYPGFFKIVLLVVFFTFLVSGCGSVSYTNIRQDITIAADLSGEVSQTFTLSENNYSLLFNQYSGDVLQGHAQDLAQALGWSEYEVKTWDQGGEYFIKLTSKFSTPQELKQMLAQAGQELDLRATDGIFSKKFGFVSTARIGQLNSDTLTVSLTLPGSIAFSNGKNKSNTSVEWNLSQDSRLTAISASLVEYDAFVQINFKTDMSGKLILGVVAPPTNIENAGKFFGGTDPVKSLGEYIVKQTELQNVVISNKKTDKLIWVYIAKNFYDSDELATLVKPLGVFKSLEFKKSGDDFRLDYALTAELFPYPKGLGNPNHMSFSTHMPGSVSYSNGALQDDNNLVWEISDLNSVKVNATSNGQNFQSIRSMATMWIGGLSLLLGIVSLFAILFSRRTMRPRLRLAGISLLGIAVTGGIVLAGILVFFAETPSNSITYLPTPGPSIEYKNKASASQESGAAGTENSGNCPDGYEDASGLCWNNLDSASGSYDPGVLDSNGDGIVDSFDSDSFGASSSAPETFGSTDTYQDTYDANDYDGDGVGNLFDNDPNYYNPPGDFDYGIQDPVP